MTIRFQPRLLPTLAALLVVSLTVYLGSWQQGRAEYKRSLQAEFEQRREAPELALPGTELVDGLTYRRVVARGVWEVSGGVFVDNRFDGGRVGYHFLAPLRLEGRQYLLVNLGWLPRAGTYPLPPSVELPAGQSEVRGTLVLPTGRFLELSDQFSQGTVWQNVTIERYRRATGLNVLPYMAIASTPVGQLKLVAERPDARVEKHVEYMLTWYSLAATAVILWVAMNLEFRAKPQDIKIEQSK